ncbi:aminoglycoside phosphotransferase family protein [Fodinicola feengrottensis]|uniref:Aminoglycoside phosphotransferase family protein n=1 Tax=Fodinicola feengrottensis TaxID=435914 RepID=A0ABP4SEZ4_9ACTN|nr:aminoglycoside phosphotransferase family protein [Fodinicola feengrottensis]
MHEGQVDLTVDAVAQLVGERLVRWRGYDVSPVASDGTVNALFRLGSEVVLRFPLLPSSDEPTRTALAQEQDSARRIARVSPVQVPEPLALQAPHELYPGWWTAYRWIQGEPANPDRMSDEIQLARDLAAFVRALGELDTEGRGWDGRSRGGPLAGSADQLRAVLADSVDLVDVRAIARVWRRCLEAAPYAGPGGWLHADLMPGNLLLRDGRLAAVIDPGAVCVGDPAVDLMPAWNLFTADGRGAYRDALEVDEAAWERGRGWAIVQATSALPYYLDTNPAMADNARRTLAAVLE